MTVPTNKIKVTERIRKEITKIDELAEDIECNGLINPITVMALDGGEFQLLAGLRRLKALEKLSRDEIAINIVSPADAEAALRIEISENEQREPFTFSEKMDLAQLLEGIEKAKALERKSLGGKGGLEQDTPQGADVQRGEVREIVADKIGMGRTTYDRAKYIAENAPEEGIDELDKGERAIRPTYDELKAKEKAEKDKNNPSKEPKKPRDTSGMLTKAEEEAIERNNRFHAMSAEEKVVELQSRLDKAEIRACKAESNLSQFREFHNNTVYHKDSIIDNLQARLDAAEARLEELEAMYGTKDEAG